MGKHKPLPLMRVVADLYERIDFQKDTIDSLRSESKGLAQYATDLEAALELAIGERDAAIEGAALNDANAAAWHEASSRASIDLARVQDAANRAYAGIVSGTVSRDEAAAILAPVIPEGVPLAEPTIGTISDIAASVREILADLKSGGPILGGDLPPGFISLDAADLPASLAEKIAAQHAAGAAFVEVDAADLPRDVFRRIFGLDRQPKPEPAKAPECFGEGCTVECNEKGCARERDEAARSEADHFILEAAEQHGFTLEAPGEAGIYSATSEQVIAFVKAAREQGRPDMTPVTAEAAE